MQTLPGEPEPYPNANACTRVGVVEVEVTAINRLGGVRDQRRFPCFPHDFDDPGETQAGPTISPGDYELVVRGVRRNGVGWTSAPAEWVRCVDRPDGPRCQGCVDDPDDPDGPPQCHEGILSCDCRFVRVVEDETVTIDDLRLAAPPECQDGIDNDQDGLIDDADPGCMRGSGEADDISEVQIRMNVGLLGHNRNALCSGLGISRFSISVDGEEIGRPLCTLDTMFFTIELDEGEHVLEVVALDPSGEPLTHPETFTFESSEAGGFVETSLDFGDADFLQPIQASTTVPLSFSDDASRGCAPVLGGLVIDQVRIEALDARGEPLPSPVQLDDQTPLDGSAFGCPSGLLRTEVLNWGGYLVSIEALSAEGEVCFATPSPEPLAPSQTRSFAIPRTDPVPDSCRDCQVNADCAGGTCEDGVCRL